MSVSTLKKRPAGDLDIVNVNISYVTGETVMDKLTRLVNGNYLRRGVPFIGKVLSGSQYFIAGYLYNSDGKLYGSLLFQGISSAGGIYRVNADAIYKVTT